MYCKFNVLMYIFNLIFCSFMFIASALFIYLLYCLCTQVYFLQKYAFHQQILFPLLIILMLNFFVFILLLLFQYYFVLYLKISKFIC